MILAIVTEETCEEGRRRCVARLGDLGEEKPYGMLGLGPGWSHRDIAVLVMHRFDLGKAAEVLGRSEDACRRKLRRLILAMGVDLKKEALQIMVVFPKEYIERIILGCISMTLSNYCQFFSPPRCPAYAGYIIYVANRGAG